MKASGPRLIVIASACLGFALSPARGGDPGTDSGTDTSKPIGKIYYTTQWIKVESDSGVTEVPIDTKVTGIAKAAKDRLKVKTDRDLVFEASPDQITDDPAKARELAQQEAAAKAAKDAAAAQASLQAATAPTPQLNLAALPAPATSAPTTSGTSGLQGTSLDKGDYDVVKSPKPKPTPRPPPIQIRR